MATEVTDETIPVQQVEHLFAFVEIDPDPQLKGGAIHGHSAVETGNATETLVDLNQ
ncbi:hypothetical protein D3C84_1273360 [compost metagenome]